MLEDAADDGLDDMDGEFDDMNDELDDMGEDDLLGDDDGVVESDDVHEALPDADDGDTTERAEDDDTVAATTVEDVPEGTATESVGDQPAATAADETAATTSGTGTAADAAAAEMAAQAAAEDSAAGTPGRPYLESLPDGYAAELVVMEWLEFLVAESNVRETSQALGYYERIDWIDEDVADELRSFLSGFENADGGTESLTIDHHKQSLRYISQLGNDTADRIAMALMHCGGGADGIQR
jgi:flagellar protein FlaE